MSSIVHDFFKKQEPTDDMIGTSSETYHFLKDVCAQLALPGSIDVYYYVKDGDAGHIMVALSDTKQDPYDDDIETEENYEVEFSDFEYVKVGESKVPEVIDYFRNHKYQDLIKQRFATESKKIQDDYQKGCNSFNGMRYKEKAATVDPLDDPNQTSFAVEDRFNEIFGKSVKTKTQNNEGRIS